MKEPLWKTCLNWGTVVTFLTLPLVMFGFQLYHLTHPGWIVPMEGGKPDLGYLLDFMRNISLLVLGLAGLRTWENIQNGKNGNGGHK